MNGRATTWGVFKAYAFFFAVGLLFDTSFSCCVGLLSTYLELILDNLKQENNEQPEEVKHEEKESCIIPQCLQICLDSYFMFLQITFCRHFQTVISNIHSLIYNMYSTWEKGTSGVF